MNLWFLSLPIVYTFNQMADYVSRGYNDENNAQNSAYLFQYHAHYCF